MSPTGPNQSANSSSAPDAGFIAVFDGQLDLKWSYHFFEDNTNARTVITDISIRVEDGIDFVTYCGASNNGNQPGTLLNTMLPARPFQPPPSSTSDVYAGGDVNNSDPIVGYSQWDGIVGRLSAPHSTGIPSIDFHSIVGGAADDILLGISQPQMNRFVVVGSTRGSGTPAATNFAFPLTETGLFGQGNMVFATSSTWELGTALEFHAPDMTLPAPGTNPNYYLRLEKSRLIGTTTSRTVARDVLWQDSRTGEDFIYVVGSTNYTGLATEFPHAAAGTYYGASSGFLVASVDLPVPGWVTGKYINQYGIPGASGQSGMPFGDLASATGALGIAAWNEYSNHIGIVGWSEFPAGTRILTSSCFREPVGLFQGVRVSMLRQQELNPVVDDADRDDMPGASATGFLSTLTQLPVTSQLGNAAAGAITVDEKGHVSTCGHTILPVLSSGSPPTAHHPVLGPVGEFRNPNSQSITTQQVDGLRLELDMLPSGTHFLSADNGPVGAVGGTTPTCALSPFGNTLAPAPLQRIYLNIDGFPESGATISVLVDRPVDAAFVLGGLFLGYPTLYPSPWPGLELFADPALAVQAFSFTVSHEALRLPLSSLPSAGGNFTVQFVCLLGNTDFCTSAPSCASTTPCQSNLALSAAASPALWITY